MKAKLSNLKTNLTGKVWLYVLLSLTAVTEVEAASYYWDLNGATANTAVAATGNWDGSTANWNTASSGTGGTPTATVGSGDDLFLCSGTTYTAGTITASGTRAASSISFQNNIALTLAGAVTVGGTGANSGIYVLSGDNASNVVSGTVTLNGNITIQNAGTSSLTLSAASTLTGTGNLTLNNNSSGSIAFSSTTAGAFNHVGSIINSGTGSGSVTFTSTGNAVVGANVTGIFQNSASSALSVCGNNASTYAGGITVNSGVANIVNSSSSGSGTITLGDISGSAAASIYMGSGAVNASPITVRAGSSGVKTIGSVYSGGGTGTTMTWSGNITANDNVTVSANGAPSVGLVLSGSTISIASGKTMTLNNNSGTSSKLKISGTISSADSSSVIQVNSGGATLSGANTFSGTVQQAVNSGVLTLGNVNAVQNATLDTGASGTQSVTFGVAGSNTYNIGALQDSQGLAIGANTISVGSKAVNTTFSGAISGSGGSVTKVGTSTLTLSGVNTYSGATTVQSGQLVGVTGGSSVNSALSIAATTANSAVFSVSIANNTLQWTNASLTVNNGGTSSSLDFNFGAVAPSTTVAPLSITGSATFTTTPAVTVELQGNNVTAGQSYPLMTYSSSSGTVPTAVTITVPGRSSVTGHLTVTGSSPSTLNLVIDTAVSTEPLSWATGNGTWDVNNSGNVVWKDNVNNSTYYQPGDAVVFDNSVGSGGTVTLNTNVSPAALTVSPTTAYTISGTGGIIGSTILNKTGTGALTLATTNTYSGGTTLSAGQLNINNGGTSSANSAIGTGALTIAGSTTIDNTSGADVTLQPAIVENWNADFTYAGSANNLNLGSGAVTLDASRQVTVSGKTLTVGGTISDSGNGYGLTKAGAGTLTLAVANNYSGGTTINAGVVNANVTGALDESGNTTNNGTLNLLAGVGTYTGLTNSLTGSGIVNVTLGTGSGSTLINGNNSGFTGTMNVGINAAAGAGKVQLNGALSSSASVNVLSNATVYVSGAVTQPAAIILHGGATGEPYGQLRLDAGAIWSGSVTLTGAITNSGDGLVGSASGTGTISGNIGGSQALSKAGSGNIVLSGTNTYGGGLMFINGGGSLTLMNDQSGATGGYYIGTNNANACTLNIGSASQSIATLVAVATNSSIQIGSLSSGSAYEVLSATGANGYPTTVTNNGTFVCARSSGATIGSYVNWIQNSNLTVQAVGGYGANLTINAGGTLKYAGANPISIVAGANASGSGTLNVSGGTLITSQGFDFTAGVGGYDRLTLQSGGTLALSASVASLTAGNDPTNAQFQLGTGGGVMALNGYNTTVNMGITNISGQSGGLTITGPGELTLTATNVYTGDTIVSGGVLDLSNQFALGTSTLTMNGGSVVFDGGVTGNAFLIGGLAASSSGPGYDIGLTNSSGAPVALTVGTNLDVNTTYAGVLSGSGSLIQNGNGILTLSGANTYTGNTTVSAGTLEIVNPAIATNSTVTVANGAYLQLDFSTTNTVAALVLSGVSQSAGIYNSTTGSPFITGSGALQVGSAINLNPTNITATVSSGSLILSWPADHTGWILQGQTNALTSGLGMNWVDIPGSATVNSVTNTINPANPCVFYRLRTP